MWRDPAIPYWRLSGVYFFYFALLGAWLPYWGLFLEEEGFDSEAIGWLSAILMATKIVAPGLWGWLADRTGDRLRIIRWGNFLALLCFLGIFVNREFFSLALVIAGYSFFWNAVLPQFEVVTLSFLGERYRNYSQIRLWGSVGFVLAVILFGAWFDYFPIQTLPIILAGLLFAIWLTSLSVRSVKSPRRPHALGGIRQIISRKEVVVFFLVAMLLQFSHGPYYTFYSIYLEDLGFEATAIGLLWSLGVIAEILLFVFMHRILFRYSIRTVLLLSLWLSALRWYLIGYLADDLAVLIFAQILHAASFGSFHAVAIEYIRRYFRGGHQGQGQAIYSSIGYGGGGALGALASGYMWDVSPSITFAMAAVACVVAAILVLLFMRVTPPEQV